MTRYTVAFLFACLLACGCAPSQPKPEPIYTVTVEYPNGKVQTYQCHEQLIGVILLCGDNRDVAQLKLADGGDVRLKGWRSVVVRKNEEQ